MEVLAGSLRRMHFSDEESDRLIDLTEEEVLAIVRHVQPDLRALIDDAADNAVHLAYQTYAVRDEW